VHARKAQGTPRYCVKKCDCLIYASGTLADGFKRRNTGCWEWPEAVWAVAAWSGPAAGRLQVAEPQPEPKADSGVSVKEAAKAFLLKCESRRIQASSLRKYRTFTTQLLAFCESRGYVKMRRLGVGEMDLFYQSWPDDIQSRAKKLERLRAFVKFCVKRKRLAETWWRILGRRSDRRPPRIACPSLTRNWRRCIEPVTVWGKFVGRAIPARGGGPERA
jgi:hypothetical protein